MNKETPLLEIPKPACWKCGHHLLHLPKKVPFRAECDKCGAWLHCCRNCTNYKPGLPNDCKVPGTDPIADREAANFCEDFNLLGKGPEEKKNIDDVSRRLFGEAPEDKPKGFDSLF